MYNNITYAELLGELSHNFDGCIEYNFKLYKGIASKDFLHDYYMVDPTIGVRKSKTQDENGNIYNLLFNNLPNWKELSKREKSIIGTTNINTANAYAHISPKKELLYGKTYVVIPKPRSIITIAPSHDIWYSFQLALGDFGLRGANNSLVQFNLSIIEIFKAAGITESLSLDWSQLVNILNEISSQKLNVSGKLSFQAQMVLKTLTSNSTDIMQFIDASFDPARNKLIVTYYRNDIMFNNYKNNEVWTESQCLLIEINQYRLLNKSLNLIGRVTGSYHRNKRREC